MAVEIQIPESRTKKKTILGNRTNTGEDIDIGSKDEATTDLGNTSEAEDNSPTSEARDLISIQVTLDEYGPKTTWILKNEYNEVIAKGGPYNDGQSGTVKVKDICHDEDGCYSLIIKDAYGDGICCEYGYGKVKVKVLDAADNLITSSDGYFGRREKLIICRDNQGLYRKKGDKDKKNLNKNGKKKGV